MRNFKLDHKVLPEECKVFLDVIDIMETTQATTLDELIEALDKEQQVQEALLSDRVKTDFEQETVDFLLDSVSRLSKARQFFQKYFKNV